LKTIDHSIFTKRLYIKPEVTRIALDRSIVLMQMSNPDPRDPPAGKGSSNPKDPFASPFGDKPFG